MLGKKKKYDDKPEGLNLDMIENSTLKVIVLASAIIILSVFLIGGISYVIAKDAVVDKLKTRDLNYIAQSISAKIDGRIQRAKETSLILSRDPSIMKWIADGETDETLGSYAKQKITDIAEDYDYSNSFIVSAITRHYWAENGRLIDTMSADDPDDSWFFNTIRSKEPLSITIDYNKERKDTFVFVNALVGDAEKPLAVTGIGLTLKDISQEFRSYKFGEKSNMWLIDSSGDIYISEDMEQTGKNIREFVPKETSGEITTSQTGRNSSKVLEYRNKSGEIYDLISQPIKSTDWKLVFQIPRSESTSIVNSIKINTGIACVVSIILIILLFQLISRKVADPYKRAVLLSQELERKVNERTQELNDKNTKIMDSIEYAKLIQESILPPPAELDRIFSSYFLLWRPRDIVGGDFYFVKRLSHGILVIVGDCTGHGVPGALMTMAVNTILNQLADGELSKEPAVLLSEMNRLLKQNLYGKSSNKTVDEGLDAGVIYVSDNRELKFAGAKTSLYIKDKDSLKVVKGNNKGIGYRNTRDEYEFSCYTGSIDINHTIYLTTDGYTDQNGGEKDLPFGKKRFEELVGTLDGNSMEEQKGVFEAALEKYMGSEPQRDDITVIGFRPGNIYKGFEANER